MAKGGHKGAFVFGSVLGGAVGAVAALWKTPQSGEDLRRKLGFESDVAHGLTSAAKGAASAASGAASASGSFTGKALSVVEHAAAPLVGVKLGQTANNSQPGFGEAATTTVAATPTHEPSNGVTDADITAPISQVQPDSGHVSDS